MLFWKNGVPYDSEKLDEHGRRNRLSCQVGEKESNGLKVSISAYD
jgi:hypothetical protein